MLTTTEYNINGKKFYTRLDFLNYCFSQTNSEETFNSAEFKLIGMPESIDLSKNIDPLIATSNWINNLRKNKKPIVLMFSGGMDSIFALDCMIKSKCPPDYLLIYHDNHFNNTDFFCGTTMESAYAIKYAEEIIKNNSILKNTKIWTIRIDKKYAENYYANDDWINNISFRHSVETVCQRTILPLISNEDQDKYTFISGGNPPKVKIIDGKTYFYVLDYSIGPRIDTKIKKTYDFLLDNPDMFEYISAQYFYLLQKNKNDKNDRSLENMYECHPNYPAQRYIDDFKKLIPNMPGQLDKRFEHIIPWIENVKIDDSIPYYAYLNRSPLKVWLLYLQAEFFKPVWFENYKKSVLRNQERIKKINSYPSKITKLITTINHK